MKIELIPVIELGYQTDNIPEPEAYPPQEHPGVWSAYRKLCFDEAGFPDDMTPYLPGEALFRPEDISDANLEKILRDIEAEYSSALEGLAAENEEEHSHEDEDEEEHQHPHIDDEDESDEFDSEEIVELAEFYGGFVLRAEGKDIFYPQCCGTFADFYFWYALSCGDTGVYSGHPRPQHKFHDSSVTLTFAETAPENEPFIPYTAESSITIPLADLDLAVKEVTHKLELFSRRIDSIVERSGIQLNNAGQALVFGIDDEEDEADFH